MDAGEAFERLKSLVDADTDPTLTTDELLRALRDGQVTDAAGNPPSNHDPGTWAAATAVKAGTVIVDGNDRHWVVVIPGTTDAVEPVWPDRSGTLRNERITVADGGVVWADNGTAWRPTWNLNRAAVRGWELKAGKATSRYNFATDDQRFERAQVAASCREQADMYRRRLLGSITA